MSTKVYYKNENVRQRQFEGNPITSGVTRQSYQDSDIFGNKTVSEVVQRSAQESSPHRQRH